MSLIKSSFYSLADTIPTSWLDSVAGLPLLLPYHHVVSDQSLPHIKGLYGYKSVADFSRDLDWLLRHRNPVDPQTISEYVLQGKRLPSKAFLLTFDDGFREVYEVVAPLLKRKGVPAIFFVNPLFIDNVELFYRAKLSLILYHMDSINDSAKNRMMEVLEEHGIEKGEIRKMILSVWPPQQILADELGKIAGLDFSDYLKTQQPFLTTDQVIELHSQGFAIGAHSMDHPHYGKIDLNQQLDQTMDSLNWVRATTSSKNEFFSFPHEDKPVSRSFFEAVRNTAPERSIVFFGTQNHKFELQRHVLHRYNAELPERKISTATKAQYLHQIMLRLSGKRTVVRI